MNINEFNEAIASEKAVVVKLSAEWCQPCKALDAILTRIEPKHENLKVVRVDVEENPEIASQFGITNVPVLLYYKDGEPMDMSVGLRTENELNEKISKLLE